MSVIVLFRNAVLTVLLKGQVVEVLPSVWEVVALMPKMIKTVPTACLDVQWGGWSLGGSRGLPTSPLNLAPLQPPADP